MNPVFVHAADLHLGAPLRSLGASLTEEAKAELLKLVEKAFDNLINKTIEYNAEFIVLAGDIYDSAENDAKAQLRFSRGLRKLLDNGIGVYIVHGNHDPMLVKGKGTVVAKLPDGVHRFEPGSVQSVVHQLRNGGAVTVAGVSFANKDESENLALQFDSVKRGASQATIGVLHTNVGGATGDSNSPHANYAPCKESDLRNSPVDYWALGHVHKRSVNLMSENRYWAYPGNLQGRDAGEPGERGALVVEILADGVGEPQFFSCDEIRFEKFVLDCSLVEDIPGITALLERVLSEIDHQLPVVCRLELTGSTAAHNAITETVSQVILEELHQATKELLNGGYIEKIEDRTTPPLDIEFLRNEDDLLGDLLTWISSAQRRDVLELVGQDALLGKDPETINQLLQQIQNAFLSDLLTEDEDESE